MVSLTSLWLPILLSAVAVFVVSSIIHMALKYHNTDFSALPNEGEVLAALGKQNIPVGEYIFPHFGAAQGNPMKDPAYIEKRNRGPAGILSVMPNGMPPMSKFLVQWFIYSLVVSLFAAYLASRALPVGADAAEVFRFTATVGFLGYGLALVHDSIWYARRWSTTIKNLFDALLYGAATAAVFVWMWPR
jgi:hypothetical protein